MFNIVIFGPPGAGKGTQSKFIIEKHHLVHLSTGDVLRHEVESGSNLGKEIAQLIDKGNFVSDEMIQRMVKKFIEKNKGENGFILDGFPRTTSQAQWLDAMFAEIGEKLSLFLLLDVEEGELKKRILKRGKVSGREDDKDISIIENRIKVYHDKTKPVIDYYLQQDKYIKVNGVGTFIEVFEKVNKVIEQAK